MRLSVKLEEALNRAIMDSLKMSGKTPFDRARQHDAIAHIDQMRQALKPSRRLG